MHKELYSIKIIRDYLESNNTLISKTTNIDNIYNFFNCISSSKKQKFNSLYILNYIEQYIVNEEVAKRKTSARVFEDLLAILFNGEIADGKKRKNIKDEVPQVFENVKDKIAGNKREKADIVFENEDKSYKLSVKTLMQDNIEINMGSFEKNILFDGLDVSNYLKERKNIEDIGLGSIPRIKKLLNKIKSEKNYNKFVNKFNTMFNFVFNDDLIIAIKGINTLDLYFFKGEEFTKFVTDKTHNIDELMTVVNRWEGNSIRINRTKLLDFCSKKVKLDLSFLNKTVINLINQFDKKLHKAYVDYFNKVENDGVKDNIIEEINNIFDEFDKKMKELKQ